MTFDYERVSFIHMLSDNITMDSSRDLMKLSDSMTMDMKTARHIVFIIQRNGSSMVPFSMTESPEDRTASNTQK